MHVRSNAGCDVNITVMVIVDSTSYIVIKGIYIWDWVVPHAGDVQLSKHARTYSKNDIPSLTTYTPGLTLT